MRRYVPSIIFVILAFICMPILSAAIVILNLLWLLIVRVIWPKDTSQPYDGLRYQAQSISTLQTVLHIKTADKFSDQSGISLFLYITKSQYRLNKHRYSKTVAFLVTAYQALINLFFDEIFIASIVITSVIWTALFYFPHLDHLPFFYFLMHWFPFFGLSLFISLQIGIFFINWFSETPLFSKKSSMILMPISLLFLIFSWLGYMPSVISRHLFGTYCLNKPNIIVKAFLIPLPILSIFMLFILFNASKDEDDKAYIESNLEMSTHHLKNKIKDAVTQMNHTIKNQSETLKTLMRPLKDIEDKLNQEVEQRKKAALNKTSTRFFSDRDRVFCSSVLSDIINNKYLSVEGTIKTAMFLVHTLEKQCFLLEQSVQLTKLYYKPQADDKTLYDHDEKPSTTEDIRLSQRVIFIIREYLPLDDSQIQINQAFYHSANFLEKFLENNASEFPYHKIGIIQTQTTNDENDNQLMQPSLQQASNRPS